MDRPLEATVRPLAALAEPRRLAIVGLLARRPHYGEELAETLGLHPATVSHHLHRLRDAGLVREERDPPYASWKLDLEALEAAWEPLRSPRELATNLGLPEEDELAAGVLARWLDQHGRLREIPTARRDRRVVLRHVASQLETGRIYAEREVRRVLLEFTDDVEALEQALVDLGWLQRGTGVLRRLDEVEE